MFLKLNLFVAIAQTFALVSALRGASQQNRDAPFLVESERSFITNENVVVHSTGHHATANRSLQGKATVRITNNCGQNISNFRAFYNARLVNRKWVFESTETQYIAAGGVATLQGVEGRSEIHYYGLDIHYDHVSEEFVVQEVASAPQESDVWTHVTFQEEQYPVYMQDFDSDGTIDLCPQGSIPTTTQAPPVTGTVTIKNNCKDKISNFKAYYNVKSDPELTFETATNKHSKSLVPGGIISIPNVEEKSRIHFYGLNAFNSNGKLNVNEVASSSAKSNIWTHVTFNQVLQFPVYMKDIDDNWTLELCSASASATASTTTTGTLPASTTQATTTTTTFVSATTATTTNTAATTTTVPSANVVPTSLTVPTTMSSTTASAATPTSPGALTIHNNCGAAISHFQGFYNVEIGSSVTYDSTGTRAISDGGSITVSGVDPSGFLHYYGLHAYQHFKHKSVVVNEVAKSSAKTDVWTGGVTFNGTYHFNMYMKPITEDRTIYLCD